MAALNKAALKGHVEIVRLLLEKEANPNICDKVQHFICIESAMEGCGGQSSLIFDPMFYMKLHEAYYKSYILR